MPHRELTVPDPAPERPARDHLWWLHRRPWTLAVIATAVLGATLLLYDLGQTPAGPTLDELSIGQNAWHLSRDGRDEHGELLPLYFKAFSWGEVGEYKNPLYIYALVPFEAAFGPSNTVLRLPAVLFALLLATGAGLLLLELGRSGWIKLPERRLRLLALGAALATLTTPWVYHFGRMALEGITFPALLVLALWLTLRCRRTGRVWTGLAAGLVWGLSLYAYSTARLEVPLILVALGVTHVRWIRRHPWAALALTAGVVVTAIPLMAFLHEHPDALTAKFYHRSVCHPAPHGIAGFAHCLERDAMQHALWTRYRAYLGMGFLFRTGDPNPLHGAPGFGELPLYAFGLLVLGLSVLWRHRREAWPWFLLLATLLSPVAASFMIEHLHSIRAFALFPFLWMVALLGAGEGVRLLGALPAHLRRPLAGVCAVVVLLETGVYLESYHSDFRKHLYRSPYTAVVEAVRRGVTLRRKGGFLYLPPRLSWRDPRSGQSRLTGHSSIIWRYYLRVPGPWYAENAERYRVRAGEPKGDAPRGSVSIRPAVLGKGPPCPSLYPGFRPVDRVDAPGYIPLPRYCLYRKD